MKKEWRIKPLSEVCEIKPPKSEARERVAASALVSFAPMEDLGIDRKYLNATQTKPLASVIGSYTYFADGDVLLAKITPCFENGKLGIATGLENGIGFGSSEFIVFRPSANLDKHFLYYFLARPEFRTEGAAQMGGAVGQQRVSKEFIESYRIPVPPLAEQQRIVGLLDEAFEGLATDKANAEKNLQNARAFFESHLQSAFTQRGPGWKVTTLGAEIDLLAGFAFKSAQYTNDDDDIRLLRGDNIIQGGLRWDDAKRWPANDTEDYERYQLEENDVVLAMDRPWVTAGLKHAIISVDDLPCLLVQRTARLRGGANLDNRFLKLLIGSAAFTSHILGVQTGIGVPHISGQQIKDFEFARPPIADQRRVAGNLESLREETQRLESIYRRKLAALDELKKSLLQKAFAGELTRHSESAVIIPFPAKISNITTTDLHAGILAIAHWLHEKNDGLENYGHVKAEKIAHMVEAHAGIDLGRVPVKDAAGPNDYPHLMRVEHRARKAGFFDFRRVEGAAYRVTKYRKFDELIETTRRALDSRNEDVDKLLELMLPLNTQQAEILATVYAAWNNLLLAKQSITDEAIVFEARENWHEDKLSIPREKFFSAIGWMKEKNIVPQGNGKKVDSKAKARKKKK